MQNFHQEYSKNYTFDALLSSQYIFNRYTGVSVIEMDFDRIDINQCPKGQGNNGPNLFADTSRCKKETTEVS